MKTVRTAPPSQTWQPIKRFPQPAPNPPMVIDRTPPSNACAAHAVKVASEPGGINPKQQVY
jgi:hypothetical protein